MFKEALATEVEHLLPSATSSALTACVGMILKWHVYLSSPITNNLQNDEKSVNLACTGEGNFLAVPLRQDFKLHFSLSAHSSINQQKINKEIYKFEAPIKTKFCINLVYPSFGHV